MRLIPKSLDAAFKDVSVAYYLIRGMPGNRADGEHDLRIRRGICRSRRTGGHRTDQIFWRAGRSHRKPFSLPWFASRDRFHSAAWRRARHRIPRWHGGRFGQCAVRDDPLPFRTRAAPGLPGLVLFDRTTDCDYDVLSYLIAAIETHESIGRLIEIGGPTASRMLRCCFNMHRTRTRPRAHSHAVQPAAPFGVLGSHGHADSFARRSAADRGICAPSSSSRTTRRRKFFRTSIPLIFRPPSILHWDAFTAIMWRPHGPMRWSRRWATPNRILSKLKKA